MTSAAAWAGRRASARAARVRWARSCSSACASCRHRSFSRSPLTPQVPPGGACGQGQLCIGLSVCVSNTCQCTQSTVLHLGQCRSPINVPPGSSCTTPIYACTGGSECVNSVCACGRLAQVVNGQCITNAIGSSSVAQFILSQLRPAANAPRASSVRVAPIATPARASARPVRRSSVNSA